MSEVANSDIAAVEAEIIREENLRRARELLARLGPSHRVVEPSSTAAAHFADTGHVMSFGCCLTPASSTVKGS